MNIIHARSKGDGDFQPTSKTLCFQCMEHGDRFVFIYGRRKYACPRHFHEWLEYGRRVGDKLLSSEEA